MHWRWHCRNFKRPKRRAEVSKAPPPQHSTGSNRTCSEDMRTWHREGWRVTSQQAFSRWATALSSDWQRERWSFLDNLSISGSILLLDWSKCELLKTQYPTHAQFYNGYVIVKQHFLTSVWLWLTLKWNAARTHPIRVTPLLTFDTCGAQLTYAYKHFCSSLISAVCCLFNADLFFLLEVLTHRFFPASSVYAKRIYLNSCLRLHS